MIQNLPYFGESLALIVAVVWAVSVILFKKTGETVSPLALNLFKNSLAFLLVIPTIAISGGSFFPNVPGGHVLMLLASGALGIGIADTFFFRSLNVLGASRSAVVDCLYSPIIIMLSFLWLGERLSLVQSVGVLMIVAGVYVVTREKPSGALTRRNLWMGILYALIYLLAMGVGIVMIKPLLEIYPLFWANEIRLLGGLALLIPMVFLHPRRRAMLAELADRKVWKYLIPGSFGGTYLALLLWLGGMKYTLASTASALNQTSSLFIFAFAALFLREKITPEKAVGMFLGFTGVFFVTFG